MFCYTCFWCYEHGTVGRTSLPLHSTPTTTCLRLKKTKTNRKKTGIVFCSHCKKQNWIYNKVNIFFRKCFNIDKTLCHLPVLSQNEVFLSVSHECLNMSTPFFFPSVVFFWLWILALSTSDTSAFATTGVEAMKLLLFHTLLTERLLLELVTCPALDLCFLQENLAFALRQHCRNFVCIAVQR